MFFEHLEQCDQVHINTLLECDDGKDLSQYQFNTDGFFPVSGRASVPHTSQDTLRL